MYFWEAPLKKGALYLVIGRMGGATLARMVWGTYLEKNCPSSKGHLLGFGGSELLPGWFGALMQ